MLIAKVQKKFFKKMFKILFQNKFLSNGKRSCQFFILKLNLSKVIQTLFLIFYHRINIPMFTYLEMYASNNDIDYHFLEVNMIQKRSSLENYFK